jgi:hypothetical protein
MYFVLVKIALFFVQQDYNSFYQYHKQHISSSFLTQQCKSYHFQQMDPEQHRLQKCRAELSDKAIQLETALGDLLSKLVLQQISKHSS